MRLPYSIERLHKFDYKLILVLPAPVMSVMSASLGASTRSPMAEVLNRAHGR